MEPGSRRARKTKSRRGEGGMMESEMMNSAGGLIKSPAMGRL